MKLRLLGVNVLKRWDADGKLPVAASSATALDPTPNSSLIFRQVSGSRTASAPWPRGRPRTQGARPRAAPEPLDLSALLAEHEHVSYALDALPLATAASLTVAGLERVASVDDDVVGNRRWPALRHLRGPTNIARNVRDGDQ